MAYDYIYYFEKSGNDYVRTLLGEVQNDFNMSFSLDGTKDSCKVNVRAYTKLNIKPYTICWHKNTNTWWVVASDRIDRFQNDKGFYYDHQLELVGAVELLNAIDLTDCGFLSDRYTLQQMLDRLISLSANLDLPFISFNSSVLDLSQTIDYTKTFENYTLLSALREIFDGYNCCIKMSFTQSTMVGNEKLETTNIIIYSKSGNPSNIVLEESFNAIDEKTNINKNNYGTSVVSNAQNVISSKAKTYPAVGSVRLSSNSYEINHENAILRLPSNIYDVNWIKMLIPVNVGIMISSYPQEDMPDYIITGAPFVGEEKRQLLKNGLHIAVVGAGYGSQDLYEQIILDLDSWYYKVAKGSTVPFYANSHVDNLTQKIIPPQGHENPYFHLIKHTATPSAWFNGNVGIMPKETVDHLQTKTSGIAWERGSNIISSFAFLGDYGHNLDAVLSNYNQTELEESDIVRRLDNGAPVIFEKSYTYEDNGTKTGTFTVFLPYRTEWSAAISGLSYVYAYCNTANVRFIVNYIPMADAKIKYDNTEKNNIVKLYNQTGKLTDSVALSKLMLSHSKEIESNKITKYGYYYANNTIPKIGSIVVIDNDKYVISNVSLDYNINDYNEYRVDGEFTLTRNIATKSLLTNPNTNIRDYNIPQNMNVKRKQLYRDFWEITHTRETNTTPIQDIRNVLNVSNQYKEVADHTAVIKLYYDDPVGGNGTDVDASNVWYYQLDCITFILKKSIYELLDFKDNNIIGYDAMTAYSGFKINEIFTHTADNICTPVSYVSEYGIVNGIEIAFCNANQLGDIYSQIDAGANGGLINYSVFIDSQVFEGGAGFSGAKDYNDFMIEEPYYNKDAIEVPVFEYSCQFDNSNDVIIGDNIFDLKNDAELYMYSYVLANKGIYDENNAMALCPKLLVIENNLNQNIIYGSEVASMVLFVQDGISELIINPLVNQAYNVITEEWTNGSTSALESNIEGKDLLIFRHKITNNTTSTTIDGVKYANSINDLMFVIRNTEDAHWEQGKMVLQLNAYKVN